MGKSRRRFLVELGGTALGLGCGVPLLAATRRAAVQEGHAGAAASENQWAMVIDMDKCLSADVRQACAEACHLEHNVPSIPDPQDEVKWIWTESYEHAFPDQVHPHTAPGMKEAPVLVLCNHCTDPSCVKVCPTKATWKRESDGLVMMDMHRCIGCRYCMAACPYGSRSFNWRDPREFVQQDAQGGPASDYPMRSMGVVEKCTFCADRLRKGQEPACVEAANQVTGGEGAIVFGDVTDPDSEVSRVLQEKHTICRRVALGNGPNVYYIPPSQVPATAETGEAEPMIENVFHGSRRYWALMAFWSVLILLGTVAYSRQLVEGLYITGMNRDVSWGLYIGQLTFLVGVAASAVMVVLPYYLHDYKAFGKTVILGEFLAVSSVLMCMLFVFVDMGQPRRVMNVLLHPTPNSPMFWDFMVLSGYLAINLVIGAVTVESERKEMPPPRWVRPLIFLSIPWAVSIHTVTAFLYSGLGARPFWLTAILAPRFLASAFAAGPSLLILLALIVRRFGGFDVGKQAIRTLGTIVAYAMAVNVFFVLVELFTALYSNMPHHTHAFEYLFVGLEGHSALRTWTWVGSLLGVVAVVLLWVPAVRRQEKYLALLCGGVVASLWIEKGFSLVVVGFIPSPMGVVTEYVPTVPEIAITVGVYAVGGLVLTALYKLVLSVRGKLQPV